MLANVQTTSISMSTDRIRGPGEAETLLEPTVHALQPGFAFRRMHCDHHAPLRDAYCLTGRRRRNSQFKLNIVKRLARRNFRVMSDRLSRSGGIVDAEVVRRGHRY